MADLVGAYSGEAQNWESCKGFALKLPAILSAIHCAVCHLFVLAPMRPGICLNSDFPASSYKFLQFLATPKKVMLSLFSEIFQIVPHQVSH